MARLGRAERLRLVEEAVLVRDMGHHALTRVLGVNTSEDRPLVVMEYVDGLSLERVLNRAVRRPFGRSPPKREPSRRRLGSA